MELTTVSEIREYHEQHRTRGPNRGNWFGKDELRFFNSVFPGKEAYAVGDVVFFVSGERHDETEPHKYTVRAYDRQSTSVDTIGKFQQYDTPAKALRAAFLAAKLLDGGASLPPHIVWARANPTASDPTPDLLDPKANVVEEINFRRVRPQQWYDSWRKAWRLCRFTGTCVSCSRRTYAFDDGENDPRGVLGDHASGALVAEEFGMVGNDLPLCAVCENDEPSYRYAESKAKRRWTTPIAALPAL